MVDEKLMEALATTDRAKKAELYADIQKQIWHDAPWIFLATEQNIAGAAKNLTGFYIQPDASFNFSELDLSCENPKVPPADTMMSEPTAPFFRDLPARIESFSTMT